MNRRVTFLQNCGREGVKERTAFKVHTGSPFCIFKTDSGAWSIGHERSGKIIDALLPPRLQRSKARLLLFIEAMEAACPVACAMVSLVEDEWPEELKPYGVELITWAREYVG